MDFKPEIHAVSRAGHVAFLQNHSLEANPYPSHTVEARLWAAGWTRAYAAAVRRKAQAARRLFRKTLNSYLGRKRSLSRTKRQLEAAADPEDPVHQAAVASR